MRIVSVNVNGLRSAAGKGFFPWLRRQRADVVCLQETRVHDGVLPAEALRLRAFHCYYQHAERKGYSGVAIYCRRPPDRVVRGLGWPEFDPEARFLRADFGRLSIISLYIPSGSHSEQRQQLKFEFLSRFAGYLEDWREQGREAVICGDWNIAHKPIDLRNWRANQKNSGFLPEERAWMDRLLGHLGWVDAFRVVNQQPEQYTWWSNRGRAWEKNVGWRIDYQIVTPALTPAVREASIYKHRRFSDHAPLTLDYALDWTGRLL
jgi:exodeoxyribonuclease-3